MVETAKRKPTTNKSVTSRYAHAKTTEMILSVHIEDIRVKLIVIYT